jgi:hypothetical protein
MPVIVEEENEQERKRKEWTAGAPAGKGWQSAVLNNPPSRRGLNQKLLRPQAFYTGPPEREFLYGACTSSALLRRWSMARPATTTKSP